MTKRLLSYDFFPSLKEILNLPDVGYTKITITAEVGKLVVVEATFLSDDKPPGKISRSFNLIDAEKK